MTKNHAVLAGPLLLSCLAIAFCIWSAFGNDVNFCVTTGCTLYQDFSIGKISMWWFGAGAFAFLGACALLGQGSAGRAAAAFFLACDSALLLLMAFTASCISCLVAALFFAICLVLFRRQAPARQRGNGQRQQRPSVILWVWLALFIVNIGQVARSQIGVWPILDESGDAVTSMYFSPSCRYCIEGVNALSGNVNTAFYPVAESDADIAKVDKMLSLLENGASIAEAMGQSQDADFENFWQMLKPNLLLLRFRMLVNKAHLFAQGSQGVPFFEHKGLMPGLRAEKPGRVQPSASRASAFGGSPDLPPELDGGLQCGGITPCPPGVAN